MKDLYHEIPENTTPKIPTSSRFVGCYVHLIKKRTFILQLLYVTGATLESATFCFINIPILFSHLLRGNKVLADLYLTMS